MLTLKRHLFDCYGGFADKRIKNLIKGDTFIVDDRSASDFNSQSHLYPTFCMIFARVKSADSVEIDLRGNVPIDRDVTDWIAETGAGYRKGMQSSLVFSVGPSQERQLDDLADRIAAITRPGAPRYSVPSYKYVCPRTAKSLRRLAETLRRHWGARSSSRNEKH